MKKKKFNRNKGILFFITDTSRSEKTSFLKEIKKKFKKNMVKQCFYIVIV